MNQIARYGSAGWTTGVPPVMTVPEAPAAPSAVATPVAVAPAPAVTPPETEVPAPVMAMPATTMAPAVMLPDSLPRAASRPADETMDSCETPVMAFFDFQPWGEPYEIEHGFMRGTIFPALDKPWMVEGGRVV